jgi:tungstate transport system substrate-binding protein
MTAMQRPFVVVEANPRRLPDADIEGARKLADDLVSVDAQKFLAEFAAEQPAGVPLFYPLPEHTAK